MNSRITILRAILAPLYFAGFAGAQTPSVAHPQVRILQNVDDASSVMLLGNVHPAVAASASTVAGEATPMEHMILFLKGDTTQEAQLAALIAQQNDPKSSLYRHFLTPQDFGAQFGAAPSDVDKVTAWLKSQGFTIEEQPSGNRALVFSGTVGQVAAAFKTEIRHYTVAGVSHYANASDPQIPAALADVVGGVVKLHDFKHKAHLSKTTAVTAAQLANPVYTYGGGHYLSPADYGVIYDINALYTAGVNGTGQTVAVLARSNIYLSDVESFRSMFGLKANNPQIVITNSDPGVLQGDSVETTLDTEWSGAVAPGATIKVIVSASTNSADGIDLSALYAVNNKVAPIVSLSYGSCEADMGSSELSFYNSLWQQAAAQGQSVMVSAGDSGAAGCYSGSSSSGSGQAVNGLCSSPSSTCVGGTEFEDTSNPGQYWLAGNNTVYGSATGYIPEMIWNESGSNGGSGLWAGGGGKSIVYAKPSWQTGPGVPADGQRDVPDVSLTASGHDGYLIYLYGGLNSVGGTSAAAPSFAGLMALVDQKVGASQGLINSILYPLAVNQAAVGAAVFHDIQSGNNSVPGVTGFSATTGYDLASGLGSVDANLLVNHWTDKAGAASIALSASSATLTVPLGKTGQTTITSTASASLKSAVTLVTSGAPTGVTAVFASSTIASPGSGSDVLTVTASSSATPGTYALTVAATGAGQTAKLAISVVIPAPTFTLTPSSASLNVSAGSSVNETVATSPSNGFSSAIALSIAGLPSGVTAAFSATSLSGTAAASSVLTFTAAKSVTGGTYSVTVTAKGSTVTQTSVISLVVTPLASCTLASSPSSVSVADGQAVSVQVSCGSVQGVFSGPLALSLTGAPSGVTTQLGAASVAAGASTSLKVSAAASATAGSYSLALTASGSGFTQTLAIPVIILRPTFTLSPSATSLNIAEGNSGQIAISATPQNGFSSPVALSLSGLPTGATAAFSSSTVSGTAASTLTLTTAKAVKVGSYPLVVSGTGGGVTQTFPLSLVVTVPASCTLAANSTSVNLTAGQSAEVQVSCGSVQGAFSGPLALAVTGAPSGVTAQAASTSLTAGASTVLNVGTSLSTTPGTYSLSLSVSGSGFAQALALPVVISAANTFTIAPAQSSISIQTGASAQTSVTSLHFGIFNSAVSLSVTGLPSGVTASLTKTALAAPGDGTVTATFAVASSAKAGSYSVVVSGSGGGQTETAPLTLTVTGAQGFSFAVNISAMTIQQGGKPGVLTVSTGNFTGGFNSTIDITFSGLAPGMNWGPAGATTGNNLVNVSTGFTAATYTPLGTYPLTITATGAGITHSAIVQVTVTSASAQKK
jgi:subtilase family serine protease